MLVYILFCSLLYLHSPRSHKKTSYCLYLYTNHKLQLCYLFNYELSSLDYCYYHIWNNVSLAVLIDIPPLFYRGGLQFRKTVAQTYLDVLPYFSHNMHSTLFRNCKYILFNPNVPCLDVILTNSMQSITCNLYLQQFWQRICLSTSQSSLDLAFHLLSIKARFSIIRLTRYLRRLRELNKFIMQ